MKIYIFFLILTCTIFSGSAQAPQMMFSDRSFAKDPHVVNFKGRYLMYYSARPEKGNPAARLAIGIASSKDLIHWEKVGEVTHPNDVDNKKIGIAAPSALVRDGKVHLFYQIYEDNAKDVICHAVSTDGIHFEPNPTNPIFHPTGEWNCERAIDAEVCEFKGKYFLYFATRDPEFKIQMLGVATAPAGTNFNREDWTQAVDASILYPTLPWEQECIEAASVTERNGKLYMFYAGAYNNSPQQIGVAVSRNGLHWERLWKEPFLANGKPGEWNECESGHPHIFADLDGRTYLFFQGNNDKGRTWFISQKEVFWNEKGPYLK